MISMSPHLSCSQESLAQILAFLHSLTLAGQFGKVLITSQAPHFIRNSHIQSLKKHANKIFLGRTISASLAEGQAWPSSCT